MKRTSKKSISRRKVPKQTRGIETTRAILEATRRILRKHGAAKVNTNAIAKLAGVSIGSIYKYFPNKKAIYVELYREHTNALLVMMKAHIEAAPGENLQLVLKKIVHALIEAHEFDPDFHRALSLAMDDIVGKDKNKAVKEALYAYVQATLSCYHKEIPYKNVALACHVFFGTIDHLVHFAINSRELPFATNDYLAMTVEQSTAFLCRDSFFKK